MRLAELPPITNILIIDDIVFDAEVLASTLRLLFGHGIVIRHIRVLREIRKALADQLPDVVFLDDRLGHATPAEVSLGMIQSSACRDRVIVLSGLLTRVRQIELKRLGVADIVHKDDIDAARLAEAILKVLDARVP